VWKEPEIYVEPLSSYKPLKSAELSSRKKQQKNKKSQNI